MRLIDADTFKVEIKELSEDNNEPYSLYCDGFQDAVEWVDDLLDAQPTIEPVKHGHYNYIKYLYLVDGYYVVNETMECSECNNSFLNDDCNYCYKCGAKLDKEPHFFRKKTTFVEGENALVPISRTEYKCAEDWEYEIV